jgi:hypothetical protein
MADDLGRHPLAQLALGLRVDRQGEVGMGLDVDKAGRDREPRRVDDPGRTLRQGPAERRDPPLAHQHVAGLARPAAAVDDKAALDQDVAAGHRGRAMCAFRS